MARVAVAASVLSAVAIVLAAGGFLLFHLVADAAGTGMCGGG